MPALKRVQSYDSLDLLPPAYAELFGQARRRSFFLSLPWFMNLRRTALENDAAIRIYGVETESKQAVLALPMRHRKPSSGLAPRKLDSLANYYSSLFGPIAADSVTEDDLDLLARQIAGESPRWDIIDFHPLDKNGPSFQAIANVFRRAGMAVQPYFCFGNWYLEVNGRSYQDYFESLPSKLKNTLQRKTSQLEKTGSLTLRIVQAGEQDVEEAIAAYQAVYASSWKHPEPHPEFMPSLIRLCAKQGWLRLGVAYIDGEPAAAQCWIVQEGTAHIYKLAYDERFAKLSIGSLLTARLMRHVIDIDGVAEVDYLTGDEPYKRDWMSHRRERWGITVFNLRTPKGMLAAARHLGGQMLKTTMKRFSRA